MLAIIIGIAVICVLFGIGAAIAKAAKVILWGVGGLFLLLLAIGLIQEYGMILLKIGLGIFAVLLVLGVISVICEKIKLIIDSQKYIKWLNGVGVGEVGKEPFGAEAKKRAIVKGAALRLNETYTASQLFYRDVEYEMLQRKMFTLSDFTAIAQARSGVCLPTQGVTAMMEYLAKKNSFALFDPTMPAMPAVPEYCCIQQDLSCALADLAKQKGITTPSAFRTAVLSAEPIFRDAAWIPQSYLDLMVSRGEMERGPRTTDNELLYVMKGLENLESESTTTEISWDDL